MRLLARRQFRVDFGLRQLERGAIVDRRPVHRELAFAATIEFALRFKARIEHACRLQGRGHFAVARGAVLLARLLVPREAEPCQIIADRLGEFLRRAGEVGVIEPEQKRALVLARKEPVEGCGSDVADVEAPGRARGEADARSHHRSFHGLGRAAPYPASRRWQGLCLVLVFSVGGRESGALGFVQRAARCWRCLRESGW